MGDGMARNLIKGGRHLVVWNRTGSKAVDFSRDNGCEVADSPRQVQFFQRHLKHEPKTVKTASLHRQRMIPFQPLAKHPSGFHIMCR